MNVQIIKGIEVVRPDTTPLKSSVLDHARAAGNLHDRTDGFGLANNEGLWPSYNCLDTLVPTEVCPDPLVADEDREPKTFDFAAWQPAFDFPVYGGVQCRAVGLDKEDMRSEIQRVFGLNEGKGVERALLENRFIARAATPESPIEWDAPVDLNTAATINPQQALALLEGYAAQTYAGVPTIHMPRAVASLLGSNWIVWQGDLAFTRLGSKVAIGGGYDTSETDGTWDMFATGEVYIERSETVDVVSYVLPGDGSIARGLPDNTVVALAERMFRVAVDCFVARATATAWTA